MYNNQTRRKIIENYIHAYNTFDISGMQKDLHEERKFEIISNGQVNLTTNGIEEFKTQANIAKEYFREREQKIVNIKFKGDMIEVNIEFVGILAKDLPNGLKSSVTIRLEAKSVFRFRDDKIFSIQDISKQNRLCVVK